MNNVNLQGLGFADTYLIPQYSEVSSRDQVDTKVRLPRNIFGQPWDIQVPVISANMDTVTGSEMAREMSFAGAVGALHRFLPIKDNVEEYLTVRGHRVPTDCFVSVGVNRDSKERTKALFDVGARYFVIDIAHGHSKLMRDMIDWLKGEYPDVFLMAGNVATAAGAYDLACWGADAIKIGIGPGAVCLTKNVTGVTVPQLGAIQNCFEAMTRIKDTKRPLLIADGGIREYGDIAKAIAAGADMVMIGSLLASCPEAPGERIHGKKVYRGMASKEAMSVIRDTTSMPTPEGTSMLLNPSNPVCDIVAEIAGGLRSAFSYSNAKTLKEFQERAMFGIKKGVR